MRKVIYPLGILDYIIEMATILNSDRSVYHITLEDNFPLERFIRWLNGIHDKALLIPQELFVGIKRCNDVDVFKLYVKIFSTELLCGIQPGSVDLDNKIVDSPIELLIDMNYFHNIENDPCTIHIHGEFIDDGQKPWDRSYFMEYKPCEKFISIVENKIRDDIEFIISPSYCERRMYK